MNAFRVHPTDAWSPALPADGTATPDHLADLVWSYFTWDEAGAQAEWARPRARAELATLIHHAFQASLRSEEERAVRFQVVFDLQPTQLTVRFEHPLAYGVANLVKLSPTIGIGSRWLVTAPASEASDRLHIVGICDPQLTPHATAQAVLTRWAMGIHVPEVYGIGLSVFAPGWLRVSTWAQRFFELRDCAIRFPFTLHEIADVHRWYEEAAASCGGDTQEGTALVRRMWGGIVSKVRDSRHGGCLVVVPTTRPLAGLPLRLAFALGSRRLRETVAARAALEPALSRHVHGRGDVDLATLDDAHFLERSVGQVSDLVAALAAVDGAVVLRRDLEVVGFGAEFINIGTPRADEAVVHAPWPPGSPARDAARSLASFGMRHRSAYRFCEQVEGAIAFVVSQDGDVRVFTSAGGHVVFYDGPTPEDWIIAG